MLDKGVFNPKQIENFYTSQQISEHPVTKSLNLEG